MCCSWAGVSARFFWEMDSRGLWSTIDINPDSLCSKDDSEDLSFYVGIMAFSFSQGFAGKGNGFVVLQEHHTKAYL